MIVEIRTYTCRVGAVPSFLEAYEKEGLPLQRGYLGEPIGWFVSEVGRLNEVVHLWRFEDMADRETRRAAMQQDDRWRTFLRSVAASNYLISQASSIYRPTSFSKMQ
ncbi:NIPSNAP family protein [Paraburkholderia unamae]|uniref:NIPSNAP protein n=1 Tax=Paraburkholderia unamae TaxID=219649 RepID=A0ABX5KKN5_9BURK|nr:NIPSNAP family protein [Paraburkholderia unamae]PVX82429.1 NIPSNAP protein [Paraburkholderia unamae]